MKEYEGRRFEEGVEVTVNGKPLNLRLDLRNHSPTGFDWGYGGSGPSQLALALLADYYGNNDRAALAHYQSFKFEMVLRLPHERWTLTTEDIAQALERIINPEAS